MKRYLINHQIKASEVRLIDSKGGNIGIIKTTEALAKALEARMDLVEISSNATPPVCKILDVKKFLYQEKQKERESSKKVHKTKTKEFVFGPYIGDNDLRNKVERARKFLAERNKVRITVELHGREKAHPEIGREKLDAFIKDLTDVSKLEGAIDIKGGFASALIAPK